MKPVREDCSRVESIFRKVGRPPKLSPADMDEILAVREFYSIRQMAQAFEVSRSCIWRVLKKGDSHEI